MRPWLRGMLLAVAIAAPSLASGCKRNKPPARVRIWLGPSHACSLQRNLELECWGNNDAGQLGDRSTTSREYPGLVANGGRPDDVAIGARHTCALSGGGIRCWGDGARGQLGTGLVVRLASPSVPVAWHGAPLAGARALAAGGDQTCAVTEDGVRCWGDGKIDPAAMPGMEHADKLLAVGPKHVCVSLTEPKAVRCAGADDRGQSAGNGPILAGAAIKALTAGAKHSCALLEDGSVQCWGANDAGQLGDGTAQDSRVPALVSALPPAVEIHAGASHTCARLRNNTVACWGANAQHQLVDGTTKPSSKPIPVPGLIGVVELAVGGDSACVRLGDGEVRCWGANASGQLGDGTTAAHDVPMPVRAAPRSASPAN